MYVDCHKRDDVVKYHNTFSRRMVSLSFLKESCTPTEDVNIFMVLQVKLLKKNMVLFHDESTFQANVNQSTLWEEKCMICGEANAERSRNYGITFH